MFFRDGLRIEVVDPQEPVFPSYTMVAGNPAKIIKIYDKKAVAWVVHDAFSKKDN